MSLKMKDTLSSSVAYSNTSEVRENTQNLWDIYNEKSCQNLVVINVCTVENRTTFSLL